MKRKPNKKKEKEFDEIISNRILIFNKFKYNVQNIKLMTKQLENKDYKEYVVTKLPLEINSPMEDAIRYKFFIITEIFKKFSTALCYKYFKFKNPQNMIVRYRMMNMFIFNNENNKVELINLILDYRNILAHTSDDDFTDFFDEDVYHIDKYSEFLLDIFEEYLKYIKKSNKVQEL
ncbi:hypothetical protein [Exiguobacterium sp. RIT341]|uniref:hypothetical protein n=1 Tax=Exiguobacterium sp. RIT341 TaxID=1470592 RepID=UPI00044CE69A|nr:hypothetical protein [Exiguobacterium sp. RIT341]EZP58376.1 hypothetical protein BW42_03058 [Exiguobacterium sp. RIT341]